jgi:hypothetical protein
MVGFDRAGRVRAYQPVQLPSRGPFEARRREILGRDLCNSPAPFTFFYEREALRYQPITTALTDEHETGRTSRLKR